MKSIPVKAKVSFSVFIMQGVFTLWFIGITLLIHIGQIILSSRLDEGINDLYSKFYIFGNIYMFIIGIIAANHVLPYFVKLGVTRKDSFIGIVTGTIALAVTITVTTLLLNGVTNAFLNWLNIPIKHAQLSDIGTDPDAPFFVNIILNIVGPPVIEGINFASVILFTLNLLFYYVMGLLIGSAFYRFVSIVGLLYIVLAVFLFVFNASIWGKPLPGVTLIPDLTGISYAASFAGTIVLLIAALLIIRFTTKDVRIKL